VQSSRRFRRSRRNDDAVSVGIGVRIDAVDLDLKKLAERPPCCVVGSGAGVELLVEWTAALINERWLKAWGKLPVCSPLGAISSE
jgi:hypothetical protein